MIINWPTGASISLTTLDKPQIFVWTLRTREQHVVSFRSTSLIFLVESNVHSVQHSMSIGRNGLITPMLPADGSCRCWSVH